MVNVKEKDLIWWEAGRRGLRAACPEAARRLRVQGAGGARLHALCGMGELW